MLVPPGHYAAFEHSTPSYVVWPAAVKQLYSKHQGI
jgi:hypothetical protein